MPRELMHQGPSMAPFFRTGDRLVLEPCGPDDPRPGDVIVFERHGLGLVSHRVVAVTDQGVLTRGDANRGQDPWVVTKRDILGRVIRQGRGRKTRPVPGGLGGAIEGHVARIVSSAGRVLTRGISPLYRGMARSSLFPGSFSGSRSPGFLRSRGAQEQSSSCFSARPSLRENH